MYAGSHFTNPRRMESCVTFSGTESTGAPLTNFNDGGGGGATEVHILYPKRS